MKNFKEIRRKIGLTVAAGVIAFGGMSGAEKATAQDGSGEKDQPPAPLAQVVSGESASGLSNIAGIDNPGEVPPLGEEVAPPESAPLDIKRFIDGTLVTIPVDHYERRGEQLVGVDDQGEILVEQILDIEMRNEWFIRTLHSDGLPQYGSIPMDFSISNGFFDPTSINDLISKLESTPGASVYASDLKGRITAAADMSWHQSADTSKQLNSDISWMANLRGTDRLAPTFQKPPQSGEEQMAATLLHLVSVGANLSYSEVIAAQQTQQPLAVELPNGEVWDPSNGFHLIIGRNFTAEQYTKMAASRAYTLSPDTLIFIDNQGRLTIKITEFSICSGTNTIFLAQSLSKITEHHGAQMVPGYEVNPEILAIMFSPIGNNQYTWPLNVYFTTGSVVNSSPIKETFYFK